MGFCPIAEVGNQLKEKGTVPPEMLRFILPLFNPQLASLVIPLTEGGGVLLTGIVKEAVQPKSSLTVTE